MRKITLFTFMLFTIIGGVKAETVAIYEVPTELSPWQSSENPEKVLSLSYDGRGKLSETYMTDKIRVTFTTKAGESLPYALSLADPSGWNTYEGSSISPTYTAESQSYEYTLSNAIVLEGIQLRGIIVRGNNVTVSKVELIKVDGRYDAAAVTIGEDGIATWSSSKKLDFSGSGVTPYFATACSNGVVTLTSTTTTWGYEGYIIKGAPNTYTIPVTANATYPSSHYLKATSDYSGTVAASTASKYHYIFAKDNSGNIGFYKLTANHTLAAHKAYLETDIDITPAAGVKGVRFIFSDDVDGVVSTESERNQDEAIYTLNGTRVKQPKKGIYIMGGRIVFVK